MECFICAAKIGRGNANVCRTIEEKMDKLISVSQRVEHSSTIISDILSRILNETVMKQETICRICFNLLNDIDYHLKEAQEKTDEITNKFLDREKDPLSYKPQPMIVCASTPAPLTSNDAPPPKAASSDRKRRKSGSSKSSKSRKAAAKAAATLAATTTTTSADDTDCVEDENMSVNVIDKSKAKLFSHILTGNTAPASSSNQSPPAPAAAGKKTKSPSSSGKKQHKSMEFILSDESDSDEERGVKQWPTPLSKKSKKGKVKSKDVENVATVNMQEHVGSEDREFLSESAKSVFYAVKSEPATKADAAASSKHDQYVCEICNNKYKRALNLQLHMEKVHSILGGPVPPDTGEVPESHKCDVCNREFTNAQSLQDHKEDHERERKERVEAAILHLTEDNQVKKSPAKSKPEPKVVKEPKAQCDICKQTFQRMFNLKTHINRVHNKIKDHKCTECPKAFATASDLKQHLASHGIGKIFTCEICSKVFHNRDSAIFHRKKHTQEYTHFCSVCEKGFYKSSCVTRHMRTHTGEKPFNCDNCHKGFGQMATLKTHLERCKPDIGP